MFPQEGVTMDEYDAMRLCSLSTAASRARRERLYTKKERNQEMLRWVAIAMLVIGGCFILAMTPWYL